MGQCYEGDGCEEAIAEKQEDYAVRAAREWFAPIRQKLIDDGDSAELYTLDANEEQLAAIIRKHAGERIETEKLYTALTS